MRKPPALAGKASRVLINWWRSARAARIAGRKAAKEATETVVEKVVQETAESVAEAASAEAAEQVGQQAVRAAAKKMRPFTKANARHNLQVHTGEEGVGLDAHHIFPQAERFEKFFENAGIDIHDPKNMRWWPSASHKQAAAEYNKAWDRFKLKNETATKDAILAFGHQLMKRYGF